MELGEEGSSRGAGVRSLFDDNVPWLRLIALGAVTACLALVAIACLEDEECGIDRLYDGEMAVQCEKDEDCEEEACGPRTRCNTILGLCDGPEDAGPDQ